VNDLESLIARAHRARAEADRAMTELRLALIARDRAHRAARPGGLSMNAMTRMVSGLMTQPTLIRLLKEARMGNLDAVILAATPGDQIGEVAPLARLDHPTRERLLALPEVEALGVDEESGDYLALAPAADYDAPAGWPATTVTLTPAETADLRRALADEAEARAAADRGY
jgi:hypothetical protein